jgi:uncharacterized protein (TIGR02246 family)
MGTDELESGPARLLDGFTAGWNAASGTELARVFAPDADFTNIMGLRARGRDVIGRGHDELLATLFRDTRLSAAVDYVRLLRADVAVVEAALTLEREDGQPFQGPVRSRVKYVAVKDEGSWSIVSFTNMIPFERPAAGRVERELAIGQTVGQGHAGGVEE